MPILPMTIFSSKMGRKNEMLGRLQVVTGKTREELEREIDEIVEDL